MSHPGQTPITTDSSGAGTASITPNKAGFYWHFTQLSVDFDGSVISVALEVDGLALSSLTTGATPLTASGDPPIDIGGHETLSVIVSQGPPSSSGVITYFYDEIAGTP